MARKARRASLVVLCALASAALLPSAAGAVVVGIGDNDSGFLSDPMFLRLHIHEARVEVEWDAAVNPNQGDLQAARTFLNAARAHHVTPLVSFAERPQRNDIPSVRRYTRAVRAFIRKFPWVKRYAPWNEPDWCLEQAVDGCRPRLVRHPGLAAAYFNALVRSCHRCTVLAGDVYLPARLLRGWLRGYIKGLRYRPAGWALHNYWDVRSHTTSQLRVLASMTRGPIWLDEISGVVLRAHWPFPHFQTPAAAARDERFLFFTLPRRFHRISRIYHFQWRPGGPWDSALFNPDGSRRPAYCVVARAAHARC